MLGIVLLLGSAPPRAQRVSATTGNKLLEECEAAEPMRQAFCLAYIIGATDVGGMDGQVFPERRRTCAPDGVSNGQLRDVVVKYLKEHPETRHYAAALLVGEREIS